MGFWKWYGAAIALPKLINNYHCLGLFAQVCGPILTSACAMWCDNTRLNEELIECQIGSFVQVHIKAHCNDLIRIDLQAALQRSIHTLHLPVNIPHDDLVKMTVFVPQGVTCFLFRELAEGVDRRRPPGLSWQKPRHHGLP